MELKIIDQIFQYVGEFAKSALYLKPDDTNQELKTNSFVDGAIRGSNINLTVLIVLVGRVFVFFTFLVKNHDHEI